MLMRVPEKPRKPGEPVPSPPPKLSIVAAGQKYAQVSAFRYLGGLVSADGELTHDINHRSRAAWGCLKKFSRELFD
ncbi:unnamed protein product, partial [Pylaiella littoralis]